LFFIDEWPTLRIFIFHKLQPCTGIAPATAERSGKFIQRWLWIFPIADALLFARNICNYLKYLMFYGSSPMAGEQSILSALSREKAT
jgi:hypothetical protein